MSSADYDAGETFGNVPSKWSNAGNHGYGNEHGTRCPPRGLPDAPTNLRKQGRTNTKAKEDCDQTEDHIISVFISTLGLLTLYITRRFASIVRSSSWRCLKMSLNTYHWYKCLLYGVPAESLSMLRRSAKLSLTLPASNLLFIRLSTASDLLFSGVLPILRESFQCTPVECGQAGLCLKLSPVSPYPFPG
ncbi:unnamed protein product [Protopolystoma xenopodis]|uniref:Uncharacterized protein n=1 Tax=Protopolystoma xenopodis TaxID=117903 RepID=A0A3S5CT18_9PLAT|nr:unnamed protein product [Protopolystoma xenopodis]